MTAVIDHVLLAVRDLDAAAAWIRDRHGLTALAGGRHPGVGTANLIVPLGDDYLELIAIVDAGEAAASPLRERLAAAPESGASIATWAVRVTAMDALKQRLGDAGVATEGPLSGSRLRPDGVLLEWRTLRVGSGLEPAVPFFIEWNVPAGEHPGATTVEHPAGTVLLRGVRLASPDPEAMADRLRVVLDEGVDYQVEKGEREGPAAVVLSVNGEERDVP
jgi:Glyoxalase-like domain